MNLFKQIAKTTKDTLTSLTRDADVQSWLKELEEARKREQDYVKDAQKCVEIYEQGARGQGASTSDYNILYANTETLGPAVYSSLPRPLVKRRYSAPSDVADQGARVLQATLKYLLECRCEGYSSFDTLMKSAVNEALVPGRGATRFKYDASFIPAGAKDDAKEKPEPGEDAQSEQVEKEMVCGEEVPWNRVLMGYGKTWSKVPWICFEWFLTREELVENFGKDLGEKIPLNASAREDGDQPNRAPPDAQGAKFAHIYEIWDRRDRKVKFLTDGWPSLLSTVDDPFGLEYFFPLPRPIQFIQSISSMVPRPLYKMYETQAKELNDVTKRIGNITRMMKIRGIYDSTLSDISEVLKKEDGTLIPATNVAALQDNGTLDKAIWLFPIAELPQVLQQLYVNRENVKKVIYELTGIADIMRGSSQASETLGAQQIKQQWGTMRLKQYQKEVQRYTVDCICILAELACSKYDISTFQQITGISLPMNAERQQAMQQMQQMQMQAQQAAQAQPPMPQAPGQPPAPPQQPQDPTQSPQWKQLELLVNTPTWEEVTEFIKSDLHRNYAIQIETNSTLAEEMAEDRDDLVQFMQSMGTFVASIMKQVQEQILPFDVAKAMILAITQKFRIGIEIEEQLKQMQAPRLPQPGQDPKTQAEIQLIEGKMQLEQQKGQQELALGQQRMAQEKAHGDMKIGLEQERIQLERVKMSHEQEQATHTHNINMGKASSAMQVAGVNAQTAQVVAASKQAQAVADAQLAAQQQEQPQPGAQ